MKERIAQLLCGRSASSVATRYGLNKNWVQFLRSGKGTYKLILPFIQFENVSADWLLNGLGQPYRTHHWASPQQLEAAVGAVIGKGGWSVFVLDHQTLILWREAGQDAESEQGGLYIEYEAHFGPISAPVVEILSAPGRTVQYAQLPSDIVEQLYIGQLGPRELFGDQGQGGYFSADKRWPKLDAKDVKTLLNKMMKAATLSPQAQNIARRYQVLSDDQRVVVESLMKTYSDNQS